MIILGITGAIGSGKSTLAAMLRRLGAEVYDADAAIHRLLSPNTKASLEVRRCFASEIPEAFCGGKVNRAILGAYVFQKSESLRRLERILHPLVRREKRNFLRQASLARKKWCVLDVPLLFETGADRICHQVIITCAPLFIRYQRVMSRFGMNHDKFQAISRRQMTESQYSRRADGIVRTGLGQRDTRRQLFLILRQFAKYHPTPKQRYFFNWWL